MLVAMGLLSLLITTLLGANLSRAAAPPPLARPKAPASAAQSPAAPLDCGAQWTVVPSPNPNPGEARLQGVAVVAQDDVWAVGYYDEVGTYQTLIEHWNGSAWTIVSSPNAGTDNNYLDAVVAVSASDVWAVGSHGSGVSVSDTLTLHWDGSTWSVVASPNAPSSTDTLRGVAAVAADDAWAVGWYVQGGTGYTLVEHWDGSTWSIVPSPNVGTELSYLAGVTAVSAGDVWAVGDSVDVYTDHTLVEHWDGSSWSIVPSPNMGSDSNFLFDAAAVAADDVWTVGFDYTAGLWQTLILHWDGSAWSVVPSPDPGINNLLKGVETQSASDIWAVGTYDDDSGQSRTLLVHWDGSAWTAAPGASVGSSDNHLDSVAAAPGTDVWAVGGHASGGANQALVESYPPCSATSTPTPGTPTATPTVTPIAPSPTPIPTECAPSWAVVDSPSVGTTDNELRAVSAISADDAWAVGYVGDNTSGFRSLTEHWDGSTWSVVPSSNPSAILNFLYGVIAVAPDDVWAVGEQRVTDMQGATLIEHWDGTAWSVVPSPNPDDGIYVHLLGVTALAPDDVWAVGFKQTLYDDLTLILHWDGSTWSIVPSPNPDPSADYLYAVAGTTGDDVWAVGTYDLEHDRSLALHWDGTAWHVVAVPDVGTADNSLYAAAALAPDDVWAVGVYVTYQGTNRIEHTLTQHWDGVAWSAVASPDVGSVSNSLDGLATLSAHDIWAVGIASNGADETLTEHWDGAAWTVVASPNGTGLSWLLGVAAVSPYDLWSVGLHGSTYQTLTEHYSSPCNLPTPEPTDTATPTASPTPLPPATATPMSSATATATSAPAGSATATAGPAATATGTPGTGATGTATPGASGTATPTNSPIAASTATATAPPGTATPVACAVSFTDVPPGSTFASYIHCLACLGIISGYADGTFRPGNDVTRGQAAKIIANSAGYQDAIPAGRQTFDDVPPGSPFWLFVERVALHGAISGYDCGGPGEPCPGRYFRPANSLTRGQLAKIASEGFGYADPIPPDRQTFDDVPPDSPFWLFAERLALHGVISGYDCGAPGEPCPGLYYRPGGNITRGQTAKVVTNTFFPQCPAPALP